MSHWLGWASPAPRAHFTLHSGGLLSRNVSGAASGAERRNPLRDPAGHNSRVIRLAMVACV
eukprot:1592563-Prymnesium_polylepis.1